MRFVVVVVEVVVVIVVIIFVYRFNQIKEHAGKKVKEFRMIL